MTRSILFVSKIAIFVFGFSVLAVSMEEDFTDTRKFDLSFPLAFTLSLPEDVDFMNVSPRLCDTMGTPITTYTDKDASPVSDDEKWRELTTGLGKTSKGEEPDPEPKKRKANDKPEKPKKRKAVLSPSEEDLINLSQEQRDLYNQIEFKVGINALYHATLSCYQWVFLMHHGKMDMSNLIEQTGYAEGTLKAYEGHLRRESILPSSSRKKRSAEIVEEEPMLLDDTVVPQLDPQSSSFSSSSSLVISFSKLKDENKPCEKVARKPKTAVMVPSPSEQDLQELNDEQLSIYNQVVSKMNTGGLALGTLPRNQWIVLAHLKGMSDEMLNQRLCLGKKTFGDYKARLKKVGLL